MKLLQKTVIASQIAQQKKQQIDEGVMIATKVDKLREKLASLEKQQQDFLDGMQIELKKNTGELLDKIAYLKSEIIELEEKRRKLLEPLDTAWENVKSKQKEFEDALIDVRNTRSLLKKDEIVLAERLKKASESSFRAKTREREIEKAYDVADQLRTETKNGYDKMVLEKSQQEEDLKNRTTDVELKETQFKNDSKYLADRKIAQDEREIELNNRERAINDKINTILKYNDSHITNN